MTVAEAQTKLILWQNALDAVSTGQSYRIDSRQLTRADVDDCLKMVRYYQGEVDRLSAGRRSGARVMRIIPRDV